MTMVNSASAKFLQKSLKQQLTRGAKVTIGDSYPEPGLRGKTMLLASKSVVKCNGRGRCAHNNCVGLAAFVTTPELMNLGPGKKGEEGKNIGWRKDTSKICLTHLRTPEGAELVPEQDGEGQIALEPTTVVVGAANGDAHKPKNRISDHLPEPERQAGPATWEALTQAAAAGDMAEVTRISVQLRAESERLHERLVDVQDKLLSRAF